MMNHLHSDIQVKSIEALDNLEKAIELNQIPTTVRMENRVNLVDRAGDINMRYRPLSFRKSPSTQKSVAQKSVEF